MISSQVEPSFATAGRADVEPPLVAVGEIAAGYPGVDRWGQSAESAAPVVGAFDPSTAAQ
ncbi:MAG: hypothetical protein HKN03_02235 [Acidimicrobiales bacterium]|nr:hypothetical protein [Acidimicrobiales bacterium]